MSAPETASLTIAPTLPAALAALAERGAAGAPFAGGTWIMRAPIRHEPLRPAYVGIGRLTVLKEIVVGAQEVELGAAVTHAALQAALTPYADLAVLAQAAGRAANPAVRAAATLGGNLCAHAFAAADLVPALLCLDAQVEIASPGEIERMSLARFLSLRAHLPPGHLLTRVIIARADERTAHARLPMRKAGDYPVAVVSLAVALDAGDRVSRARVAVGSVEPVARRWERLEAALIGKPIDPEAFGRAAAGLADEFTGREGIDAPGWYRLSVLPALVRRAALSLQARS